MATFALTNVKLYIAQYDLSGDHNSCELGYEVELLDNTTFGSTGSRSFIGGLESVKLDHNGFSDFADDDVSEILNANLGSINVVTLSPDGGDDGERAWMFKRLQTSMVDGGEVGAMHAFQVSGSGTDRVVAGTILHPLTSRSSTGNGTGQQLGAVTASQRLYSNLHVTARTGTATLDVIVQSDDGAGFGSPTTRITHAQASAATSEQLSVAGAITDDYFRTNYTIGGSGTVTFVHAVGIK